MNLLLLLTNWVPADGRLGVFELLLHSVHHGPAVQALEGTVHELWVDRVRPDHLPGVLG